MTIATTSGTVISADSHVLEPHDLWTSRMGSGPFADRAPHMIEHEDHGHEGELGHDPAGALTRAQ